MSWYTPVSSCIFSFEPFQSIPSMEKLWNNVINQTLHSVDSKALKAKVTGWYLIQLLLIVRITFFSLLSRHGLIALLPKRLMVNQATKELIYIVKRCSQFSFVRNNSKLLLTECKATIQGISCRTLFFSYRSKVLSSFPA